MSSCKICHHADDNQSYVAKEMMFGTRDPFEYIQCAQCGCLQIKEVPVSLSKYYPKEYYSFQKPNPLTESSLKSFMRAQRAEYCLYRKKGAGFVNHLGMILSKIYGIPDYYEWLRKAQVEFDSKILDVGCGSGQLLLVLRREGFSNLLGADPFVSEEPIDENGIKVVKKELRDLDQQFDFIMMHHSFEHMPNPLEVMQELYRLLKPERYALVRIPTVSSYAWKKYGMNWVQLDAPRHLYLHSIESIQTLTKQVGFQIHEIVYDSTEFQFYGSEQYLKDMPLNDPQSYWVNPNKSLFSKKRIKSYARMAALLNKQNEGDQACFYLYKNNSALPSR